LVIREEFVEMDNLLKEETDLYELLGLEETAQEGDIRKAYRKIALKYHPDKNPSEDARERFHALSKALEILLSDTSRGEYDRRRRARLEKQKRRQELDSERRRFQDDLETREKEVQQAILQKADAKRKLEMLKMEGLKRRRMHEEHLLRKTATAKQAAKSDDEVSLDSRTVKLRLIRVDDDCRKITTTTIESCLARFGRVESVAIVPSTNAKYSNALVVFADIHGASKCVDQDYSKLLDDDQLYGLVKSAQLLSGSGIQKNKMPKVDRKRADYKDVTLMRLKMQGSGQSK
jgi:DnaJ family protein C protein 17